MQTVAVSKHHGLGNDFLVLAAADEANVGVDLSPTAAAQLARRICDRHLGLGADGLLLALPVADNERSTLRVDIRMRLHNADGSVAEMSGNGIRCFIQGLLEGGHLSPGTIRVLTDAGVREVLAEATDGRGLAQVRVDMGLASVGAIAIPDAVRSLIGERPVVTVDVGNPHIVIAADLTTIDIATFGPQVEQHFMASHGGINVEVIQAAPGQVDVLDMVVWERGVGITQACGTGATACAVAAHRWGMVGARSEVRQPGGTAVVEISGDRLALIGPSQTIAQCRFSW
jgi:diaminopimelate epimerase